MRVLLVDIPRGPLAKTAKELAAADIEAIRIVGGLEAGAAEDWDFDAALVHNRRGAELRKLKKLLPPSAPKIVWYPASSKAQDLKGWDRSGADDFARGKVDPLSLSMKAEASRGGRAGEVQWLQRSHKCLKNIWNSINAGKDDFSIISTTANELENLFDGTNSAIMTISSGGKSGLVITQGSHSSPLDIPLDIGRYPEIKKMIETGKPVAIQDVKRHPLMKEVRDLLVAKDLKSILCVPIFHQDDVIGLIMLRSAGKPRRFTKTEISYCELVAQSTATALRSLRLGREAAEGARMAREAKREARKKSSDLARLEAIIERASDGIIVVDDGGTVRGININFTQLAGYELEDLQGLSIDEILKPGGGGRSSLGAHIREQKKSARGSHQVLARKDGVERQVSVRLERMPKRKEWLISLHDVTEERELEDRLRRTKDFLEKVIQSSMDAIIAADTNGTIILFNESAERISRYKSEEVVGRMNIIDFYAPGVARDVMRKLRHDGYGGQGKLEACYNTIIDARGDEIPINISASIIYEDGREVASVGIFQDLRERIKIEKELREAQEQLMSSQQKEAIMAISGAASHELNQPLTSILGYSELLKRVEKTLAEELPQSPAISSLHNAAEVISQEAERMAEVVRKIGNISEFKTRDYVGGTRIMDLEAARSEAAEKDMALSTLLFQNSSESVIVFGEDTVIGKANPASVILTGENPAGKSFTRYVSETDYTRAMEALEKLRAGETVEIELDVKNVRNEIKTITGIGLPISENNEYMVIYHDITEAKREREELKNLVAFREQIMKSSSLAMFALDVDGRITFWNRALEKMLGYKNDEVVGRLPDFLIRGFNMDEFQLQLRNIRHEQDISGELKLIDKEGRVVRVYHVDTAMREEDGSVVGYLAMLFDQSDQKAFEKELSEKTGQISFLNNVVESLRSKVGLVEVLGEVLSQLSKMFPMDLAAIVIDDESTRDLLAISYSPETRELAKNNIRLYEDADILRDALFSEEPAVYDDISSLDLEFVSGTIGREIDKLNKRGLTSVATYPLSFQNQVLGTLHLISSKDRPYKKEDLGRISQITGPIIMALANARLYNRIERQNLELSRRTAWMEDLIHAAREIHMDMSSREIVSMLSGPYTSYHPTQHLSGWLDMGGGSLERVLVHNYHEPALPQKLELGEQVRSALSERRETVELKLENGGRHYTPLLEGARSALLVPLSAPDQWLGVLALESHHDEPFTEGEKLEAQILAAHITGALRNISYCHDLDVSMRFQQGLIENANALILVLDHLGNIELVNNALLEILGAPEETFLGMHFREFFKRSVRLRSEEKLIGVMDSEQFKDVVRRVESGKKLVNMRVSLISEDRKETLAIFNTSSILDRNGEFLGFIAIGQDITRYKELEQHLLHAEKLATVGQMAAGIAHELNNPLTGIINASSMLSRMTDHEDSRRSLVDQLYEEARRIETLTQNLMSYSRPSKDQMFPLDIRSVVLDSLSFSNYELSRGKVRVECDFPDDVRPIRGIKDQLQQAFINLLTNASHACAEKGGGTVTISARSDSGANMVRVEVADDGPGIAAENIPRLFDPFFTTKPEGKGTGLGLSIVRDIVDRHGGDIRVECGEKGGTRFIIDLPRYEISEN